jgi:hypothetical protein
MNTSKLKNYAPAARTAFIEAVTRRAGLLGIQPSRVEDVTEAGDVALIGGQPFPRSYVPLRKQLLERIKTEGFTQVMEAMAYTWFNRLVALRYMELHGYLDHGYRVLSDPLGGSVPEILQKAEHVTLTSLDRDEVIRLKLAGNRDEELYRTLLLAQCEELHRILPDVFGKLDDATLLLLPDNLLHSDSVIRQLVGGSEEADWDKVEVLGWLYQFYISEKKDAVMARKSAVPTEDIPAVTQLFTPHWIVRYLVENSLGRLWLLNRPGSRLREHMPYYIEGEAETDFLRVTKPEDIRLLDPAVGSGHMLTYAFDLLYLIYEEEGYAPGDIPGLILRHNLHGLEICPRAAQLAELALVFKAREKSRRFFQPEHLVRPHIIELRDVRFVENELRDYIHALGLGDLFHQPMLRLLHQFEEAKNFGSLIQPCLDERAIADARRAIEAKDLGGQLFLRETHLKVLRVLEQAEALTQRYHVVVANPPYLGLKGLNTPFAKFAQLSYPDSSTDLFAMFIERATTLTLGSGYLALITMQGWMFQSSFQAFRSRLLKQQTIVTLAQLGSRAFDSIGGDVVQTAAFCFQNASGSARVATYLRLTDGRSEAEKDRMLRDSSLRYSVAADSLYRMPGHVLAYWASDLIRESFAKFPPLKEVLSLKAGISTGDNTRFQREWAEVSTDSIGFMTRNSDDARNNCHTWYPCHSGGPFRKWYGNHDTLVYWKNDGIEIRQFGASEGKIRSAVRNEPFFFKEGLTYSKISSGRFAARYRPPGFLFDDTGRCGFAEGGRIRGIQGFLSSTVAHEFLKILTPTLSFTTGELEVVPFAVPHPDVDANVAELVSLARADWDNFETSWDFRDQPLLRPGLKGATLEASWRNWEAQSTAAIRRMQELETENNRLFIAAYGLDGELEPSVPEAQITLARAEARRDMAAFLSYAVGCMMGRYSLTRPGLVLADAGSTMDDYWRIVGKDEGKPAAPADSNFIPDADGIIPVLDSEWFEDDIVARTKEFLRATFGEATLGENIGFIEKSLAKELRAYFLSEFYKDHLQTYKNRPIYWLFSSGKEKAFQCLVYLHRYTPATLARIRTEYVIPLQGKLAARIGHIEEEKTHATATSQRKKLQTEQDKLRKQQAELLKYDEQLRHHADLKIALDLDDGVKVNYAKLGPLVAEAKKICGTKEED